jgi:hypothetical protein
MKYRGAGIGLQLAGFSPQWQSDLGVSKWRTRECRADCRVAPPRRARAPFPTNVVPITSLARLRPPARSGPMRGSCLGMTWKRRSAEVGRSGRTDVLAGFGLRAVICKVPPAAGASSLVHYAVLETKRRRTGVTLISRSQTSCRGARQAADQGTQPGIASNRAQDCASGGTGQSRAPGATSGGGPAAGQRERSDSKDHCRQIHAHLWCCLADWFNNG